MKTSEVCYVCGSRGASCILHVRPQDSGVSYFSFLESHVAPRGARKPDTVGAVSACTVCSAFLNQQWDAFERTRTPLIKRLYWLKRIDNGTFTGAEMSIQGEYVAQLMGLHGGISASSGGGSPFEYGNHAGISCGKPELPASDDESVASDSTNGALDLSVSPRKFDKQARKRGQLKVSGIVSRKRSSNGVLSSIVCYVCKSVCHHTLARFIYSFKSSSDEPHFPFLLDLIPPAGAMQLTKTGVTQVCAECRKTLTRQWRSFDSRAVPETDRVYWINDVAFPGKSTSLQATSDYDQKERSAICVSVDICYLCGEPGGASHWIATKPTDDTELILPFVAQLKCPTGARPIGADGRTCICSSCFVHIKSQWNDFDAGNVPAEKRTFVLRPIPKTPSADSDVTCKKVLTDCPVLANVLSAGIGSNSEKQNDESCPYPVASSRAFMSTCENDNRKMKTSLSVGMPNGDFVLCNGSSLGKCCGVCGSDCDDVNLVGHQSTRSYHLRVNPAVDVTNSSCQDDTKEALLLPFFPFLAQLHGKVAHGDAVQSCAVCYVNLIRQWKQFEMSSSMKEHRWQRQYFYQTVNCDICHKDVERQKMTVVSADDLIDTVDSSVDGLNVVCQLCHHSLTTPGMLAEGKTQLDSDFSANSSNDVRTSSDAVTSHGSQQRSSTPIENHLHAGIGDEQPISSAVPRVTDSSQKTEVCYQFPVSNVFADSVVTGVRSLNDNSVVQSHCFRSSPEEAATCSQSSVAFTGTSTTTVVTAVPPATNELCTTVGDFLPPTFSAGSMDGITTPSLMMQPHLLQQQQQASMSAGLAFPSYFGLSPLFNSLMPTSSLLGGFPMPSMFGGLCPPISSVSPLPSLSEKSACKQYEDKNCNSSLPKTDADGAVVNGKHGVSPATTSPPAFHRPFLDIEDSLPTEKLPKCAASEVKNGLCTAPILAGCVPPNLPTSTSNPQSPGSTAGQTECGVSLAGGDSECRKGEDSGRDRRLNAALGLISLADVSSDAAQLPSQAAPALHCAAAADIEGSDALTSEKAAHHNCMLPSVRKFVWPGIDAVIEAYASHFEELQLEHQCLVEQQQLLEERHCELKSTAEVLTGQLQTAKGTQDELDHERTQLCNAVDRLKGCLRPFL